MSWFSRLDNKRKSNHSKKWTWLMFSIGRTVPLNYEEIECNPEKVSNIKPFINKYDLERISYPLKIDAWKRFEKNNLTIALNILHIKEKEILQSLYFKTKLKLWKTNNSISNEKKERWHCIPVKKISAL